MEQELKIVGHISIPSYVSKRNVCKCDDCGNVVDNSFGDPRVKVTTTYSDGTKEIRYICSNCDFMDFGLSDEKPRNIFDATPDWIRML